MRLESVVLHGFKSFGHRTTVKVLPGITAIVLGIGALLIRLNRCVVRGVPSCGPQDFLNRE